MKILVLNCGSSSIKYKLFDMTSKEVMMSYIKMGYVWQVLEILRQ